VFVALPRTVCARFRVTFDPETEPAASQQDPAL
jgi:hypothetical protein